MSQTTDELLALAAKAHGNLRYIQRRGWLHVMPNGANGRWWDPVNDDGDLFKLCRMLGINIDYSDGCAWKRFSDKSLIQEFWGWDNGTEVQAILRVAAAIGYRIL